MKALNEFLEGRNSIRKMFGTRPLSLDRAKDRQLLADDISACLSPEILTCDGELPRSMVQRKWKMLTSARQQLQKLDATVEFYE